MGIFIYLNIMPNQIDRAQWEDVYKETLELIHAYPFMDCVIDRETFGIPWVYTDRTRESVMDLDGDQTGWYVFGDEETMMGAESFILVRDLGYYLQESSGNGNCHDVLFSRMYDRDPSLSVDAVRVFDSKTQGYPHHIPLLGIACLIESRFPEHAIVFGDISLGQMEKAIKWANTILKRPIELTPRADQDQLLNRIRKSLKDDLSALQFFMDQTLQDKDAVLGDLIRKQFNSEVIRDYFKEVFSYSDVGTIGFESQLSSFFNQGFSVEEACDICVLDLDGCGYDPTAFVKAVLSLGWSTDTATDDLVPTKMNHPHSAEVETVSSLFGKMFMRMAGAQEQMYQKLTRAEVASILREKLGHLCKSEIWTDMLEEEKDHTNEKLFKRLMKEHRETEHEPAPSPTYDIGSLDELVLWRDGDTIHPRIEERITHIAKFIQENLEEHADDFELFQQREDRNKIELLIAQNRYFYLRRSAWDFIIQHVTHSDIMNSVFAILSIEADEMNLNKLCKALLNNTELLRKYVIFNNSDSD